MGLRHRIAVAVLVVAGVVAASGRATEPAGDDSAQREVAALIAALGASGCEFRRNGRWHSAGEAQAHLQRKLDLARRRGTTGTAEQFIERAATRSSISGRPYGVRCPDGTEAPAAAWLRDELARQRAANSSQPGR